MGRIRLAWTAWQHATAAKDLFFFAAYLVGVVASLFGFRWSEAVIAQVIFAVVLAVAISGLFLTSWVILFERYGWLFRNNPPPRVAFSAAGRLLVVIRGRVVDAATGLPIANACVWFGPVHIVRSDPSTNCVFTDGAGLYSHVWINGPSTIPLTFDAPGYVQRTINVVADDDVVVDAALTRAAP